MARRRAKVQTEASACSFPARRCLNPLTELARQLSGQCDNQAPLVRKIADQAEMIGALANMAIAGQFIQT